MFIKKPQWILHPYLIGLGGEEIEIDPKYGVDMTTTSVDDQIRSLRFRG